MLHLPDHDGMVTTRVARPGAALDPTDAALDQRGAERADAVWNPCEGGVGQRRASGKLIGQE